MGNNLIEMKITNIDEQMRAIKQGLSAFTDSMTEEVLHRALMKPALMWRDAARNNAPVLNLANSTLTQRVPGVLIKNIVVGKGKPLDGQSGLTAVLIVGVRRLSKKSISNFKKQQAKSGKSVAGAANPEDPFYWRFMEFGFTDRGGKWHAGVRFLRNAFETLKIPVIFVFADNLKLEMQKAATKLGYKLV